MMTEKEQAAAEAAAVKHRRPSTEVDKERAETYLKGLDLPSKVALIKTLKASVDAEVKSLTEAAAQAASITNGL